MKTFNLLLGSYFVILWSTKHPKTWYRWEYQCAPLIGRVMALVDNSCQLDMVVGPMRPRKIRNSFSTNSHSVDGLHSSVLRPCEGRRTCHGPRGCAVGIHPDRWWNVFRGSWSSSPSFRNDLERTTLWLGCCVRMVCPCLSRHATSKSKVS